MIADVNASERAFIGSLLHDPHQYWQVRSIVQPQMITVEEHRMIYDAVSALMEEGRAVTTPALNAKLPPEYGDGEPFVGLWMSLKEFGSDAGSAIDYADALRDRSLRISVRRLSQLAGKLERDPNKSPDDILTELHALILEAQQDQNRGQVKWLHDAAQDSVNRTAENFRVKDEIQIGLRTGAIELDQLLGPIMGGDLVTIAAPSGHGKTTLAMQLLMEASKGEKPALLISMEMQAVQIARRALAAWTEISARDQRSGEVDMFDFNRLSDGVNMAHKHRIMIDDAGRQSCSEICKKVTALHRQHGLSCVAIDHILLVKTGNPKWGKIEIIEHAAMEFKELAKKLDIPVFLLAQLTRGSQDKANSWKFTDQALYGGDAIKQASDIMLGVTLPRKWLKQREPDEQDTQAHDAWFGRMERWAGKAEIGALKMRDDDDGNWLTMPFDGRTYTFGTRG